MKHHGIAVLGATGSIGQQVIEIIEEFPERFELVSVAAGADVVTVAKIKARHRDTYVAVANLHGGRSEAPMGMEGGEDPMVRAATHEKADLVVVAISGLASLKPTLAALEA